jgi:hypothetical protein
MMYFTDDQLTALAAALCAASDKAIADKEGCDHLFVVRWKEGVSVCLVCRELIIGPNEYCIKISVPKQDLGGNPISE